MTATGKLLPTIEKDSLTETFDSLLTKTTIGDLYREQPVFIDAIRHAVQDPIKCSAAIAGIYLFVIALKRQIEKENTITKPETDDYGV